MNSTTLPRATRLMDAINAEFDARDARDARRARTKARRVLNALIKMEKELAA